MVLSTPLKLVMNWDFPSSHSQDSVKELLRPTKDVWLPIMIIKKVVSKNKITLSVFVQTLLLIL